MCCVFGLSIYLSISVSGLSIHFHRCIYSFLQRYDCILVAPALKEFLSTISYPSGLSWLFFLLFEFDWKLIKFIVNLGENFYLYWAFPVMHTSSLVCLSNVFYKYIIFSIKHVHTLWLDWFFGILYIFVLLYNLHCLRMTFSNCLKSKMTFPYLLTKLPDSFICS